MTDGRPVRAITVAVCTYGEAPHLADVLASLAAQEPPAGARVEILCVDNNPVPRVTLPDSLVARVRVVREPTPGLSRARNAAVAHAQGDALAFLDDDAVAAPGWIAAMAEDLERAGAWCLGGRVLPRWPGEAPAWLHPQLRYLLSIIDLGDEIHSLRGPIFPCGANLAIRRFVFDRVGLFRPALGRQPGSLLSGEEIDLFRRVLRAGGTVAYTPRAVVHHIIPASRLTPAFLHRRAWWEGKTLALLDRIHRGWAFALGMAVARTGLAVVREPAAWVSARRAGQPPELAICRAQKVLGYWAGLFAPICEE
ncbi:MAG: glycosyltransferase [Anaerolineae bacterium]|nr:glycosyltransferase [Anaerolineae bacterium]